MAKLTYTEENLFNMSSDVAETLRDMVRDFREQKLGFPAYCSETDWEYILVRIEDGFEAATLLADDEADTKYSEKELEKLTHRFDVGMEFFKDYFFDLWG